MKCSWLSFYLNHPMEWDTEPPHHTWDDVIAENTQAGQSAGAPCLTILDKLQREWIFLLERTQTGVCFHPQASREASPGLHIPVPNGRNDTQPEETWRGPCFLLSPPFPKFADRTHFIDSFPPHLNGLKVSPPVSISFIITLKILTNSCFFIRTRHQSYLRMYSRKTNTDANKEAKRWQARQ